MTTPLTLPVIEIEDAVDYYGNLLGVKAHWNSSSEAVLSIPSEEADDLHLVETRPEALLRALDDGSLDFVIGSLWRMTGGWTVAPGKGGVCCQACGQNITAAPNTATRTPMRDLVRRIPRRKTLPSPTDSAIERMWRKLGDSPLISRSAIGVLQSVSVRKIAVLRARRTEVGVRVSFADDGLPDVLLVGAGQTPSPGSALEVPIIGRQAVTLPFYRGKRRRVLVASDRIRLT